LSLIESDAKANELVGWGAIEDNDTYHVGKGDKIIDSDGKGRVLYQGQELHGGKQTSGNNSSDDEKIYEDASGNQYQLDSGGTLHVRFSGGGEITIENYSKTNKDLGITLTDKDDDDWRRDWASPLVLDLDGDGIETTQLNSNPVYFDVDKDGLRERSGWVSADDGLLVLDRNQNGSIDDASELFGYGKTVTVTAAVTNAISDVHPVAGIDDEWSGGFAELAALQTINDGVVDANDAVFNSLRVWRDFNQDGVSDTGELFSLAELNITSINLNFTHNVERLGDNLISDHSSYTTSDGTTRKVGDVWFAIDQQGADYHRPEIMAAIAALPQLAAIGVVKDLQIFTSSIKSKDTAISAGCKVC
jgi:hypothetical protein